MGEILSIAPARGRGLKQQLLHGMLNQLHIAPARGRGLKQAVAGGRPERPSIAPARGRGLKLFPEPIRIEYGNHRPRTGARIETKLGRP